jgi:hypothetical protein
MGSSFKNGLMMLKGRNSNGIFYQKWVIGWLGVRSNEHGIVDHIK